MGCGSSTPVELLDSGNPSQQRRSTVDTFIMKTQTVLQQHAVDLSTPKENQKIKHEILGTFNSDSVSDIILTGDETIK